MDIGYFRPGCRVKIRNGNNGVFVIKDVVETRKMKGKGNARLIRGGRLRVRLAKLNGGAIESTYLLRQLEPVVCVDIEDCLGNHKKKTRKNASNAADCDNICIDTGITPTSSLDRNAVASILSVGPHIITVPQLQTLKLGEGQLADSILDGYCYALRNCGKYSCLSSGRVHLVSSLALSCLLTAARSKQHDSNYPSLMRFAAKWRRWSDESGLVVGPFLRTYVNQPNRNHWILLAFSIHSRSLWVLDSLGMLKTASMSILRLLKKCNRIIDNNMNKWTLQSTRHSRQTDDESCGLFVLQFLTAILENDGNIPPNILVNLEEVRSKVLGILLDASSS